MHLFRSLTHSACIISFSFSARHTPVVLTSQLVPSLAFTLFSHGFPFLSRIPRVSLVFVVAFSVLARLTVPLVSQLPTHSANASISVFPGGVPPCMLFWAACSLAFFGFLRAREFTCCGPFDPVSTFSLSHVWFAPSGSIRLLIKSSNTDPFRRGVLLFIGPSSNSLCPVSAPRHYLPLRGYVPGPLFVSSNGCFLFSFLVNSWLRYFSHSLHYSSHSFRIGATISAADCESSSSPYHNSCSPVS